MSISFSNCQVLLETVFVMKFKLYNLRPPLVKKTHYNANIGTSASLLSTQLFKTNLPFQFVRHCCALNWHSFSNMLHCRLDVATKQRFWAVDSNAKHTRKLLITEQAIELHKTIETKLRILSNTASNVFCNDFTVLRWNCATCLF